MPRVARWRCWPGHLPPSPAGHSTLSPISRSSRPNLRRAIATDEGVSEDGADEAGADTVAQPPVIMLMLHIWARVPTSIPSTEANKTLPIRSAETTARLCLGISRMFGLLRPFTSEGRNADRGHAHLDAEQDQLRGGPDDPALMSHPWTNSSRCSTPSTSATT